VASGPSGTTPKYLSALFHAGTAAGLRDRELLERFGARRGTKDEAAEIAFAALVERYGPMVLATCRAVVGDPHQAEDAFQATFLVLANRSQAVRRDGSVGAWLHGVALRVAACARSREARRRRHERRYAEMTTQTKQSEGDAGAQSFDDVGQVLHEEIGRLPAKYHSAVVLCYLQGLTHDQTADQLGWPVGTVRRRLAWARDRLRVRLTRRGAAPSLLPAGLLGSGPNWDPTSATGSVPVALAEVTVHGALVVSSGKAALAGVVSAEAVALMRGVLQSMMTTKLTMLSAAVLTAGLITSGAGLMAYSSLGRTTAPQSGRSTDQSRQEAGQAKVGKPEASGRTPEDQLDALLRDFDETMESNRRSAPDFKVAPEKQAQVQENFRTIRGIKGRVLDLATRHPRTNAAERALVWLASDVSFDPEASKARELLARDHARSDRLKALFTRRLELYWASQGVEDLLRNALEQNPYREIRGLACFWLAEVLSYRAQLLRLWPFQSPQRTQMWRDRFGPQEFARIEKQDPKKLEDEVARLYERVMTEFPNVLNNDTRTERPQLVLGRPATLLPDVAKAHLDELRRLAVGSPAPEIQGVDLDGKAMNLSDFRGKVVVLFVAGFERPYAASPERARATIVGAFRQLAKTIDDKSVAFLGVIEADREGYKNEARANGLPIRFWWDPYQEVLPEKGVVWLPVSKRPGPILAAWDAETPNWYVIDARGVIRYNHVFGADLLEKAVTALLKEQEK
jgi:RNA polymerase sigma factor (sigma-70 family)